MYRKLLVLFLLLSSGYAWADLPGVQRWDVQQDFNRTYREVYRALGPALTLDASGNAVMIQTIKLENEGWERDKSVTEPTET